MRLSKRNLVGFGLRTVAAMLLAVPALTAADEGPTATDTLQLAVWTPKELRFLYQGFTTRYSCDGLRSKIRSALLDLGARPDVQVSDSGCSTPPGALDPFPAVTIKMNVLQPADVTGSTPAAATLRAHWQPIDLRLDRDPVWGAGDCELLEQIEQRVLPAFTTRNLKFRSSCVPFQLTPGGTRVRGEVLVTNQSENAAARQQGSRPRDASLGEHR
jgi:hypothetical protein